MDGPLPREAEVFLALLALLEQHGVPTSGRIASCSMQLYGDQAVYWVKSSVKAKRLVAQALTEFLGRSFDDGHHTWRLSLHDVGRILQHHGLHHTINATRRPR